MWNESISLSFVEEHLVIQLSVFTGRGPLTGCRKVYKYRDERIWKTF